MKDPNDYNVRAVERALQILNAFTNDSPEMGISEISQAVNLHKSTTHRIVTTLLNYGFLQRADDDQRYRLGLRLAGLGYRVVRQTDVRREALPYMTALVEEWDEACDLSIFDQEKVFYLEVLQGHHALTIAAAVGQRLPAHCTASGKIFLAHLPQEELDNLLKKPLQEYTENTITSPDELRKQLESIREQGFSYDDEELEAGIRAVAVPIRNITGEVIAAISMPCPINRMSKDRIQKIASSLIEKSNLVSRQMGWKM
jgi:DNA-binding IclR family transcriptional regulator